MNSTSPTSQPTPGRARGRSVAAGLIVLASLAVSQFQGQAQAATATATEGTGTLAPFAASRVASVSVQGESTPYSVAVVPLSVGKLVAGNVLAVNFNNGGYAAAGTGTTIVQVDPSTGASTLFATVPLTGPVGIAINPTNDGVWVGSFGSGDGTTGGDLLILPDGTVKAQYTTATVSANPGYAGPKPTFDGVWGEGVSQHAGQVSFYYGTTGSGSTGTGGGQVWRIDPHPMGAANGQPLNSTYVQVAGGLAGNADAKALPVTAANAAGPQGFAYDATSDTLYVSNDANDTITKIGGAASATSTVTTQQVPVAAGALSTPENIAIDPTTGDLLVVNAGNNTLVQLNPTTGAVVGSRVLDTGATGALFGLAVTTDAAGKPVIFYSNDNDNTLNVLRYQAPLRPRLTVRPGQFIAGNRVTLTVTGTPGAAYSVSATNDPGTSYVVAHRGILDGNGSATFVLHPLVNIHVTATTPGGSSDPVALSIHTALNIHVKRVGHVITFYGQVFPDRTGQRIFLYQGRQKVGLATRNGRNWSFTHNFTASAGKHITFYSYTDTDTLNAYGHSAPAPIVL
jgi:hypothetical protein